MFRLSLHPLAKARLTPQLSRLPSLRNTPLHRPLGLPTHAHQLQHIRHLSSSGDSSSVPPTSQQHPGQHQPSTSSQHKYLETPQLKDSALSNSVAGTGEVEKLKEKLRLWVADIAVAVRRRADQYTDSAATTFAQLGRELNKVTGYQEIEMLKRAVTAQETRIGITRVAAREAKLAYEQAVHRRAQSQREVNDLLQRKSSWTDDDVGRFTALVRQDHLYEQAEARAKQVAETTEGQVEQEFTELMHVILNRYHEEQVWSDKIRSASTYGSLTVLALNMAVFILAIVLVEPWKRKRLAQTFEKKVDEMTLETIETFENQTKNLTEQLRSQEYELAKLVEVVTYSLQYLPTLEDEAWRDAHKAEIKVYPMSLIQREHLWTLAASAASTGVLGLLVGYYCSK